MCSILTRVSEQWAVWEITILGIKNSESRAHAESYDFAQA